MELALALDLGGTKVEAALVDATGLVVPGSRFRAATGADASRTALVSAIGQVLESALASLPHSSRLLGAGIGCAGPVDLAAGTTAPLNLPALADYPLRALVEGLLPEARVSMALDGLCIALAEHWVGAGRDVSSLLGMVVSTGVGGGLIVQGRPMRGGTGNAGHIGQIEVAGFTPEGTAGDPAMLESLASGPNAVAWARGEGWTGRTGEELAAAAAEGDRVARAAIERSARAVGRAIASATALCDVDLVVIGGGFSRVSPDYLDLVRASRDLATTPAFVRRAAIVPTGLGPDGPLVGAAALIHRALSD
ncbi:MAG: sugar kinase [Naasia sp.]|uniref:ROK family protein n=1 Tax=Naasia sp. TaxID=2546198 RepID=UPI002637FD49|nr:ROK family protein [Naasia sp.]MCU1571370.1 sugar kinase [Naasia sp.]